MSDIDLNEAAIMATVQEVATEAVGDALDAGRAYWAEHARKRSGHMARSVSHVIVPTSTGAVGELLVSTEGHGADREYSGYQEYGTAYVSAMNLRYDMERAMTRAAEGE